jgi:hypothetical protein
VSGEHRNLPAVVETATPATTSTLKISLAVPAIDRCRRCSSVKAFPEFLRGIDRERKHWAGLLP